MYLRTRKTLKIDNVENADIIYIESVKSRILTSDNFCIFYLCSLFHFGPIEIIFYIVILVLKMLRFYDIVLNNSTSVGHKTNFLKKYVPSIFNNDTFNTKN